MLAQSTPSPRTRLLAVALAASLSLGAAPAQAASVLAGAPGLALFADAKVTPEQAASARKSVQERAQSLRKAGDHGSAAELLSEEAATRSDPVLYLDAADAYKAAGTEDRSRPDLETGIEKARVGLDILHFLQDPRCDPEWQAVAASKISAEIGRGEKIIAASEQAIKDMDRKVEAPAPEEDDEKKRKKAPKDGRGLIAVGSLLTVVGVAGLGMIGAGVALSAGAQKDVDDVDLTDMDFEQQIADIDAKGKAANNIAYAGIAVGAVGLATGIALLVVGVKKRKKYRAEHGSDENTARVQVLPTAGRGQAGLVLLGRF